MFQWWFWHIVRLGSSIGSKVTAKNVKKTFFTYLQFCKKKNVKLRNEKIFKFIMAGDSKKSLKTAVLEFYKLNSNKGKPYAFKHFRNAGVHRATVYRWIEKIEKSVNLDKSFNPSWIALWTFPFKFSNMLIIISWLIEVLRWLCNLLVTQTSQKID